MDVWKTYHKFTKMDGISFPIKKKTLIFVCISKRFCSMVKLFHLAIRLVHVHGLHDGAHVGRHGNDLAAVQTQLPGSGTSPVRLPMCGRWNWTPFWLFFLLGPLKQRKFENTAKNRDEFVLSHQYPPVISQVEEQEERKQVTKRAKMEVRLWPKLKKCRCSQQTNRSLFPFPSRTKGQTSPAKHQPYIPSLSSLQHPR